MPANRLGIQYFSLPQLKVFQEVITPVVFAGFSVTYFRTPISRNYILAGMLLAGAAYLIFSETPVERRLSVNPTGGLDHG